MKRLALILSDEYLSGALEADLAHEYPGQVDLIGQFWRREIPLRRFLTLFKHLPQSARVNRAMNRAPRGTTAEQDRLTQVINMLRQIQWTLVALKSPTKPEQPAEIELPDPVILSKPIEDLFAKLEKQPPKRKYKFADIHQLRSWISNLSNPDT